MTFQQTIKIDYNFKNYWAENLPSEIYHSDKTAVNSSSLKMMLKSPASFRAHFWGPPTETTDPMRFGTLVHSALLEGPKFRDRYVIQPDFGAMQSKANRATRDAWIIDAEASGKIVVKSQDEFDKILWMLDSVMSHKDAFALLKGGVSEVSGYFADETTGIINRFRPDFISYDGDILLDLKTTTNCEFFDFQKQIVNFKYYFQLSSYGIGFKAITKRFPKYLCWIAIEKQPPFECAVYIADEALIEVGCKEYHTAINQLQRCIELNQWPKYQSEFQYMSFPHWFLQRL